MAVAGKPPVVDCALILVAAESVVSVLELRGATVGACRATQ